MEQSATLIRNVPTAPDDPILGVTLAYNADPVEDKLNLGVGAYRTEEGKPFVLSVVRKVENLLAQDTKLNKEYLPIDGLAAFNDLSARLLFGNDSPALAQHKVATVQAISGTGALRLGAEFIRRFLPAGTPVYISNPTWGNHPAIFKDAGVTDVRQYRYFKDDTRSLDLEGMLADLKGAPQGSVILLHTCAHNPTGVDPTLEEWEKILDVLQERGHLGFFDTAYQGFATGDLDRDAAPPRMAVARGLEIFASQSYSKNFGLYGERVGALNVVCKDKATADAVRSQLKVIVRPMYSNPPVHGARLVATILGDRQLYEEWVSDLRVMSSRIQRMRQELFDALKANGTPGRWDHILNQIGMFSYTGLNRAQCEVLIKKHHIYMLTNGRISMAGLSSRTVPKLANAIHDVVTNVN
jgi:aspartate aminotransferase